ncbi:MAG TPA: O-antigen ligase family protein [Bryobacteraceae bacterium]|nr:O-antigen ligase family protein [Bryobacteraceae bacterium]
MGFTPRMVDSPVRLSAPQTSSLSRALETATFWTLCAVMVFAPLAFGSVEAWSMFIMQSGLAVVALLMIANGLANPGSLTGLRNSALLPAVLFLFLIAAQLGFNLTLYRQATYLEFLRVVAYAIGFTAALQCLRSSDRLRQFTLFLGIFAFALAVLALLQHFTSPDKLYWYRVPSGGGNIFGPFVNHNHYAGLMEMITPFAIIGFLVPYTRKEKRILMLFAAALASSSIVLSFSRSGVIAFLVEMIFLAVFLSIRVENKRAALGVAALGLPLVGLVAWLGSVRLLERFALLQDWMRIAISRDSLRIFADHLAYGTGLGTFPTIYPQYRSFATDFFVNQAHNDVFQLMAETGIPGLALVLWFLFIVYRQGLNKARTWISSWKGAASLAAVTGLTGMLLHSFTDFNLRIPSNALFFCILCGVAASREREKALLIEQSHRFRRPSVNPIEDAE